MKKPIKNKVFDVMDCDRTCVECMRKLGGTCLFGEMLTEEICNEVMHEQEKNKYLDEIQFDNS